MGDPIHRDAIVIHAAALLLKGYACMCGRISSLHRGRTVIDVYTIY